MGRPYALPCPEGLPNTHQWRDDPHTERLDLTTKPMADWQGERPE